MNYKIYILTIERNSYRLASIKDKLNYYNINYEIFYGVDYKNFSEKKLKEYSSNGYGKVCPYPTLACALSHILLWDHISNDKTIDFAIILEDDTYLNNKLYNYINFIANNIENTIIYLYNDFYIKYNKYSFVLSNAAYCIQPKTAKKLVNYYWLNKIAFHIDFQNNFALYTLNIDKLVIDDNIAIQINGNISSMGIPHNNYILNIFYNTYTYRIFTTPVIKLGDHQYDLFHIIIFLLFMLILFIYIFTELYIIIFILLCLIISFLL